MPDTKVNSSDVAIDLAGIDALDTPVRPTYRRARFIWLRLWPKLAAVAATLLLWQAVTLTGWKPHYILPGPVPVFSRLGHDLAYGQLVSATAVTLRRAIVGYLIAAIIGSAVGLLVARNRYVRLAIGSLITGLQTMPTIAWFPFAILLFGLSEKAILFVVVLGAAPAIANGLIAGIDNVAPLLLRAGRVLGASGVSAYRFIILPAALPTFVAGLKQGWAFAWRSLMAGELLVIIAAKPSLGVNLQLAREASDAESLLATMLAILIIGMAVDALAFTQLETAIRKRWGLEGGV